MASRVLIVEDDPAQRRILEEMVKRFGFEPTSVDGGQKGLDVLAGASGGLIELVILDLMMPGMDGLEFLEKMTGVRGDVPVIVQTAQGSIETVIKAMRAGADDFVVKPISPERLRVSIQNLLKVNALTEEVKRLNKKVGGALTFDDLIASSPAMANLSIGMSQLNGIYAGITCCTHLGALPSHSGWSVVASKIGVTIRPQETDGSFGPLRPQ